MTQKTWLVVNLCNSQATVWVLTNGEQPVSEKISMDFYPDPEQPDKRTKIDLSFFLHRDGRWLPFQKEHLGNFTDSQLIENLMAITPQKDHLKMIYSLYKNNPYRKSIPNVLLTDQATWKNELNQLIPKSEDGSCVLLVEKPMEHFAGYALLDPFNPSIEALIENTEFTVTLGNNRWKLRREGILFHKETGQDLKKNISPELNYVEDWDDLVRLGTSLFYLIWKPVLEELLPQHVETLQNQVKEFEALLNRMKQIKQKLSSITHATQPQT